MIDTSILSFLKGEFGIEFTYHPDDGYNPYYFGIYYRTQIRIKFNNDTIILAFGLTRHMLSSYHNIEYNFDHNALRQLIKNNTYLTLSDSENLYI